jgi:hypothetical protein
MVCNKRAHALDLLFIFSFATLSLTWFRGDLVISGYDFDFPLNLTRNFVNYFYVWWDKFPPGLTLPQSLTQIPYQTLLAFLGVIGLSPSFAEKIVFYILFASCGASMYYLSLVLNTERKRIANLCSALFYMVNPFSMIFLWRYLTLALWFYAYFPLALGLFIKGINNQEKKLLNILLLSLVSFIMAPAFNNLTYTIIFCLLLLSYFAFYISYLLLKRENKLKVKQVCQFTILTIIILVLTNSWWFIPNLPFSLEAFQGSITVRAKFLKMSGLSILEISSMNSTLVNVFRLMGHWAFNAGYLGDAYFPYAPTYSLPIFILISFLIPILAFLPLLTSQMDKYIAYFGILALTGLFLIKGLNPPLGDFFKWLVINFPVLEALRNHYEKLGITVALSYAFMIGRGLNEIYLHMYKKSRESVVRSYRTFRKIVSIITVILLSILLFGVYAFPFWTGDVIYGGGRILPSYRVKVPRYYYEADKWLSNQSENFRIFSLPLSRMCYAEFSWEEGFTGVDPSVWLFSTPTISRNTGESYNLPIRLAELLIEKKEDSSYIGWVLALLNVKYILLHRDANWKYIQSLTGQYISTSPDSLKHILDSQEWLHLERSFDKLDFYRNEFWKPLLIWATSKSILVEGSINEMTLIVKKIPLQMENFVLLLSEQLEPWQLSSIPANIKITSQQMLTITCDDIIDWAPVYGTISLYTDTHDKQEGNASLKISGISDVNGKFRFAYDPPGTWDLREGTRLVLWLKTNLTGWSCQRVIIRDVHGNARAWDFSIQANQWAKLVFPIDVYDYQDSGFDISFDISAVDKIEITFEDSRKSNTSLIVTVDDIHFDSLELTIPDFYEANKQPITCIFTKENPTKYVVHVNASEPFFLIFSESYHKDWVAYVDGKEVKDHFMANGYANAWYINKTGVFDIVLEFWPQRLFYVGTTVSLTTLILCLLYTCKDQAKALYRRYVKKGRLY